MTISWQWSSFRALAPDELYAALQLRQLVFVVEQQCLFLDPDGHDEQAWHLLGWATQDSARWLAAYARVFPPGERYAPASVGRVITHPRARGTGLGRELMAEALRRLEGLAPGTEIRIEAQRYLEPFYAAFGFLRVSEDYLEDGIVHVDMVRPGRDSRQPLAGG